MPRPRRKHSWRTLGRRLVTGLALAAYLLMVVGLPVPAAPAKDRRQPFPCQDHPCGCRTAEECWRHCCCFSPEQRLAWARERGVQPPPYAEQPTAGGWHTPRLRDLDATEAGHAPSCADCARHARGQMGSCCQSSPTAPCCQTPPASAKASPHQTKTGLRWVVGIKALSCQGQSTLWVQAGAVMPLLPVVVWRPASPPPAWLAYPDAYPCPVSAIPPDPPPRSSRA